MPPHLKMPGTLENLIGSLLAASLVLGVCACSSLDERPERSSEPLQSGTSAPAETTQAWTPAMQMSVRRLSNPRISPTGRWIVFEVAHADYETDRWVRRLHVSPLRFPPSNGRRGSRPVERCAGCWDARWGSDDATLYVRAPDENERERVHAFDLDTGAMRPITPAEAQVGRFQVSPNEDWIAYTTIEDSESSTRWKLDAVAVKDGRIVELDAPGSVAGFSWSPAGDRIVAAYQPDATLDWRQKSLTMLDLKTGTWTPLRTGPGAAWLPRFGPRGRRVAFAASPNDATWMMDAELRVLDLERDTVTSLAPTPDRNVDLVDWHPTAAALLGLEYEGSTRRLISVPLDGGPPRYVGPDDRLFQNVHVSKNGVAFTLERWNEPPEVFVAEGLSTEGLGAGGPDFRVRQVSSVQPELSAPLGYTTMIRWTSDDGVEVEGLLTYPVGYEADTRVPLLVRLHGGPPFPAVDRYLGGTFMTAYPLASMASAGFAILQPNFRGSSGYGRRFRHDLHGDWGGQDYRDVMTGVDALVARGIADPDRLGVMGWSYGGYLTAWTITQTDRFAAASMGAAMTDLVAFDETTNLGGMLDDWFGGPVDDRVDRYRERSPITHAKNVRSPVLVQHGTDDPRVPIAPVRMFAAVLEESGIDHDLRTYAGGHGPWTPRSELAVLEQNFDWFLRALRDRGNDTGTQGR